MFGQRALWTIGLGLLLAGSGGLTLAGCSTDRQVDASSGQATLGKLALEEDEWRLENAGARLWAQNCIRCHNMRTPAALSDRQWQIAMHHMRVRAGLTAEEHESILRFLQAAN